MSELCQIIFDSPSNTYFAGQNVSGRVEIKLYEPKQIKGIRIEIRGSAAVRWTESESDSNSPGGSRDTTFHSEEEYFNSKNYLVQGKYHDTFTLPPGNHAYTFSCPLPTSLPTSLEGEHGHIRYVAEVIIERPWIWNQRTKVVFTVISHFNLNMFPHLLSPASVTAEKYFCCCCCKSGPLTAVIRIPKAGYVCGENIPALFEIDNTSNVTIGRVNLKFQQSITFRATYPRTKTRQQRIVFVEAHLGTVAARGSTTKSFSLSVPSLPPSSLNESAIVKTEYQVFLECVPDGCHTSLEAAIPINIGTIPFSHSNEAPPPGYAEAVGTNSGNDGIGWAGNVAPTAPVPIFTESKYFKGKSIRDAGDDEHTTYNNDSNHYSPTYPMYKYEYPRQ